MGGSVTFLDGLVFAAAKLILVCSTFAADYFSLV